MVSWQALDSERLREELFSDHMKERDRKARETRKAEQKKKAADFKELLESLPYIKVPPTSLPPRTWHMCSCACSPAQSLPIIARLALQLSCRDPLSANLDSSGVCAGLEIPGLLCLLRWSGAWKVLQLY